MGLFRLLTSFWFNFGGLAESRNSSISNRVQFFKVCPYETLNFLGICCNVSLFISDSVNVGLLYFFWLLGPRVCQSCLSSQRTSCWIHWYHWGCTLESLSCLCSFTCLCLSAYWLPWDKQLHWATYFSHATPPPNYGPETTELCSKSLWNHKPKICPSSLLCPRDLSQQCHLQVRIQSWTQVFQVRAAGSHRTLYTDTILP
jgi:hypothetical protein